MAKRLGVMFRPEWPPETLPAFATRAERDGFAELWVVEDCFLSGGLTMSAAALAATESITVGIGLLPVPMRNPAVAAMEIAGLARLHPHRFVAAFGHGVEAWMRQIGARPPDRLAALEETVGAVRALLHGDELTVDGRHVHLDGVRLEHVPDPPPPVLIGTTGPRALQIAGRVADGVLLPEGSAPDAVRWAREQAGGPPRTTVYAWLSLDEDRAAANEALRPVLDRWLEHGLYPHLRQHAGAGTLAVAGDADDCARAIADLWAAGADSVVLVARHEDRADQLERLAADVRPLL